ncbi:MAG: homocysteine S-methyltransferase family protein [Candidatus Bipolaricaulia bacterium]
MNEFLERLEHEILVCDGATGTNLLHMAQGTRVNILNLTHPEKVKALYQAYIKAGADIIETNTYGASSYRLFTDADEGRFVDINEQGVAIAKQARKIAKKPVYIAGAVGPVTYTRGEFYILVKDLLEIYKSQIQVLYDAGVDLIILETFSHPEELRIALKAATEFELPIVAQFGHFDTDDTPINFRKEASYLIKNGADVIGSNCMTAYDVLKSLEKMASVREEMVLSAQPNAGFPVFDQGQLRYVGETPENFGVYARTLAEAGARIIGGCCGTTPAYISQIVKAVKQEPIVRKRVAVRPVIEQEFSREKTKFEKKLGNGKFVAVYEVKASSVPDLSDVYSVVDKLLKGSDIDVFIAPDHPGNRVTVDSVILASEIQGRFPESETIATIGTSYRNLTDNLGKVLDARQQGVKNLNIVYGDAEEFNVTVFTVIEQAKKLHFVGTNLSPEGNLNYKLNLLADRIDRGARFVLIQAIFDNESIREIFGHIKDRFNNSGAKFLIGIYPLMNIRNAMFMNEVMKVNMPDAILNRLSRAKSPREEGVLLAREQVELAREIADGIYIIQPVGKPETVADTVSGILS